MGKCEITVSAQLCKLIDFTHRQRQHPPQQWSHGSEGHAWDGFLKTDFNRYSGLCQHKNWFANLNRYVSVSRYNIRLTMTQLRITQSAQADLCRNTLPYKSVYSGTHWLKLNTVNPEKSLKSHAWPQRPAPFCPWSCTASRTGRTDMSSEFSTALRPKRKIRLYPLSNFFYSIYSKLIYDEHWTVVNWSMMISSKFIYDEQFRGENC